MTGSRILRSGPTPSKRVSGTSSLDSSRQICAKGQRFRANFVHSEIPESDMDGETHIPNTPAMVDDEEHESDMEVDINEEDENLDENLPPPKKACRGRTRCIKLSRNGINEKEPLEFNAKGRVCSANASVFANWCGCIVRKHTNAPLNVEDWTKIPTKPDYMKKMLEIVGEKFIIPDDENKKKLIMCCLRDKYRNYRANLKRQYFDKYHTNEERLRNVPPNVVEEDWRFLVNLFSSEKFQVVSLRNKMNRGKQVMRHAAGTTSFAKREKQETVRNNGQHPGEYFLFQKNHTDKKGQPTDSLSKHIMDQVEEKATQMGVEDIDALYVEVSVSEKQRNWVSKIARDMEAERQRQELDRARVEAEELRALAAESVRRANDSARELAEFRASIQREMAEMRAMVGAGNMSGGSETQDLNA